MLAEFRTRYPQGSLVSELIDIDRGLYLVKVAVQVEGITLATGLAAMEQIELAEDRARERAISALALEVNPINPINPIVHNQATVETVEEVAIPSKSTQKLEEPVLAAVTQNAHSSKNTISHEPSADISLSPQAIAKTTVTSELSTVEDEPPISLPEQPTSPSDVSSSEPTSYNGQEEDRNQTLKVPTPPNQGTLFPQANNIQSSTATETVPNLPNTRETSFPEATHEAHSTDRIQAEVVEVDFNQIKHQTDIEIKRLGWTRDDGRNFLQSHYGKRSRLHLTDEELLEFLHYLESLPTPVSS